MTNRLDINNEVLLWAIKESQLPINIIERRNPQINNWLEGSKKPTFKQVKNLSSSLKIPFGFFFLKTPPQNQSFNVEFRTLNNKVNEEFSLDLKTVIKDMDYKKDWMSKYRQRNNYDKFKAPIKLNLDNNENTSTNQLKNLFNTTEGWQKNFPNSYEAFKFIREKIESLNVLVMMSGIVGSNNNRTLDVNEFRAFALNDEYAPLIFINRNDTDNGLLFSLIHEFIHILVDKEDDIFIGLEGTTKKERQINNIVAEFLVPDKLILSTFNINNDPYDEIKQISRDLKVSNMVVAIKAYKLGLISNETKDKIIDEVKHYYLENKNKRENKKNGGNFYAVTTSRLSRNFYNTVIHQAEGGTILFTEAYKLLGLKGDTYDKFKTYVKGKLYE